MGIKIEPKMLRTTISSNTEVYTKLYELNEIAEELLAEYRKELEDPYQNNGNIDTIYTLILANSKYKVIPPVTASIISRMARLKHWTHDSKPEHVPIHLVFDTDDLEIVEEEFIRLPDDLGKIKIPEALSNLEIAPDEKDVMQRLVQLRFYFNQGKLELETSYSEAVYYSGEEI